MEPIATVAGVANAIKAIAEMVAGLKRKKKNDPEAAGALLEIETRLVALKEEVFSLKEKIVALKEENSKLRGQISSKEERTTDRQHYQRKKVGQSWVMVREDEPGATFCPACFQSKQQEIPLQPLPRGMDILGSHQCPNCNALYNCR